MKKTSNATIKKTGLGVKTSRRIGNTIIYAVLIIMTVVWLFPFFGILLESFKTETNMQTPYLFPKEFGFDHYIRLFKETEILRLTTKGNGDKLRNSLEKIEGVFRVRVVK